MVGALGSPVVAVGVLVVNGNLDTADGSQPASGPPAPSGRMIREAVVQSVEFGPNSALPA